MDAIASVSSRTRRRNSEDVKQEGGNINLEPKINPSVFSSHSSSFLNRQYLKKKRIMTQEQINSIIEEVKKTKDLKFTKVELIPPTDDETVYYLDCYMLANGVQLKDQMNITVEQMQDAIMLEKATGVKDIRDILNNIVIRRVDKVAKAFGMSADELDFTDTVFSNHVIIYA